MDTSEPVELPVACTLQPGDGPARMRRWRDLHETAHAQPSRSGNQLRVRYDASPGVLEELEDLARAERECCAFARWTVVVEEGHPVLIVIADPERPSDLDAIAGPFGLSEDQRAGPAPAR